MTTEPPDDARAYTFELRPAGRGGDAAHERAGIAVVVATQVGMLLVVLLLAVTLPPARIFLVVWVVWVAVVVGLAARQSRRRSRRRVQTPSLWLTAERAGYRDNHGVTASCPRGSVHSAVRAYVTLGSRTHDELILRDAEANALLEVPLAPWRPGDVDRFTEELGVGPAHQVFIDSVAKLQRVAHGTSLDDPVPARAFRAYERGATAFVMYVMNLYIAAGIAAVSGVVVWTTTGRQDAAGITAAVVFFVTVIPLLLFTRRIRRALGAQ